MTIVATAPRLGHLERRSRRRLRRLLAGVADRGPGLAPYRGRCLGGCLRQRAWVFAP